KKDVWWDGQKWTGMDVPDFEETKAPDYVPPDGAKAEQAIKGNHPFIMQADGRSWLFVPQGLEDGPLPAHYEPHESPFENPLYPQRANPRRQRSDDPSHDPYNPADGEPGADVYPYVVTTYLLTEHHTAGGMTRSVGYRAELHPSGSCAVTPDRPAGRRASRSSPSCETRRTRGARCRRRSNPKRPGRRWGHDVPHAAHRRSCGDGLVR